MDAALEKTYRLRRLLLLLLLLSVLGGAAGCPCRGGDEKMGRSFRPRIFAGRGRSPCDFMSFE